MTLNLEDWVQCSHCHSEYPLKYIKGIIEVEIDECIGVKFKCPICEEMRVEFVDGLRKYDFKNPG